MKILVADDDPSAVLLLQATLQRWGYPFMTAADGQAAWEIMQKADAPRLLLLDWMMPGLDGLEICRRLRASSRPGYVYVIMVTCRGNQADAIQALEAGADDYIAKPFDAANLRARLRVAERLLQYEQLSLEADRQAAMSQHLAAIALLSAGIAHEINQPLNALNLMLANLQRQMDRDPNLPRAAMLEKLDGMGAQVKRISQIVVQMRAMTNMRHTPQLAPVCVKQSVRNVLKMLGPAPSSHRISISFEAPDDLPAVRANAIQMEQVVFNLVNNALQALEKCGRGGLIDIAAVAEDRQVVLQVADDGPGLPGTDAASNMDRIMAGNPEGPRMGIGLKLVKKFVTDWGGVITAANRPSGGAVFRIKVPTA